MVDASAVACKDHVLCHACRCSVSVRRSLITCPSCSNNVWLGHAGEQLNERAAWRSKLVSYKASVLAASAILRDAIVSIDGGTSDIDDAIDAMGDALAELNMPTDEDGEQESEGWSE
jgi:hypothetical protein